MSSLTIRNLSITPLQLLQVERFEADAIQQYNGWTGLVFGLFRAPYDYFTGCGTNPAGGSTGNGLEPKAGALATTTDAVTDVHLAPFSTTRTAVKAPDPASEVMRLTFNADFGSGTAHRTYTVDVPAASPRSIKLRLVEGHEDIGDGREMVADQDLRKAAVASFTAVYTAASAHLVILSSAALDRWMSTVDGSWPLSSLSLPGTHNSPAFHYALPSVRCQAVDVRTQLDNGVRFLDVRVSVNPPKQPHADPRLVLVHSVFPVALLGAHTFRELYNAVCEFLDAHPTETVLMSIKREGLGKGTDADLARQLLNHYTGGPTDLTKERSAAGQESRRNEGDVGAQPEPWRWFTESRIPSLGEARGRIVLIRRFGLPEEDEFKQLHNGGGWGLDGSIWPDNCEDGLCGTDQMRLQDFYGVMQTTTIDIKINYVCGLLAKSASATHCKMGHARATTIPPLYINFLTGSNFFNMRCWPENVAARVNPSVIEYLCTQHGEAALESLHDGRTSGGGGDGSTGIVVTDWVGHKGDWDLLRCIVAWNARLQLKQ
ncbi:MAG: hypothetical protein SEPTF4163_001329 [Sporothrix epigloea]